MEARVARLEAIIPTLATKEDLVRLELIKTRFEQRGSHPPTTQVAVC